MAVCAAWQALLLSTLVLAVRTEKEGAAKAQDANRSSLDLVAEVSASGSGSQDEAITEELPKFKSMAEQLKWKLNQARKKLRAAKQYVALADKVARLKHKHSSESQSVKDIIKKAEVTLVHAGENMGLDYVHYRRSADYR